MTVTLVAMLMVALSACSAIEGSPPAAPTEWDGGASRPQVHGSAEGESDSFFERRLADLLGSVAIGSSGGSPGTDDGYIADGASLSPFEAGHPAIANLDPALLDAVQRAALDARHDGIEMRVSSGWRSAGYQQFLLDNAVQRHGSREEARRFVNTPDRSTHVTGEAVDIAPTDAMSWLSQRGAAYGLCQTYANEMWHYELMTEPGGTCPHPLADASAD